MPYRSEKQKCEQADGDPGTDVVYKKDTGKRVGCTNDPDKYMAALHVHADDVNEEKKMRISRKAIKEIVKGYLAEGMFDKMFQIAPPLSAKPTKTKKEPELSPEEKWNKALEGLNNVVAVLKHDKRTGWRWDEKPTGVAKQVIDLRQELQNMGPEPKEEK